MRSGKISLKAYYFNVRLLFPFAGNFLKKIFSLVKSYYFCTALKKQEFLNKDISL